MSRSDNAIYKPLIKGNEEDVSSPTLTIKSTPLESAEPCKQKISVAGTGVKDTFIEQCNSNGADSMSTNGMTVFGDPRKLPFCLFSDKPNTLVVIKNKVCTLKTYTTTNGVTTSTRSPMTITKCSQIKKRMTTALNSGPNNGQQQTNQPLKPNQPTQPVLPQPPVAPVAAVRPGTPQQMYPGFPKPPVNPFGSVFPGIPQQIFQGFPQSPQTPLLSQPLPAPATPTPVTPGSTSPAITYRPASIRANSPFFSKTNKNNYYNGQRTRELIVEGRGVNDGFKDQSQTDDPPRSVTNNNMFAWSDSTGEFGLFTDTWGELWVFGKDQCSKRSYETANGQTKITSTPMTADECAAVKGKLTTELEGAKENDLGGGHPNMNVNNNHNINWINKHNTNWNNNQGQANFDWEKDFDTKMADWQKEFRERMGKS